MDPLTICDSTQQTTTVLPPTAQQTPPTPTRTVSAALAGSKFIEHDETDGVPLYGESAAIMQSLENLVLIRTQDAINLPRQSLAAVARPSAHSPSSSYSETLAPRADGETASPHGSGSSAPSGTTAGTSPERTGAMAAAASGRKKGVRRVFAKAKGVFRGRGGSVV